MDTKDKIIKASIKLFNQDGISKVTLRQIAAEIGISHGNLAYHYPNKKAILEEVYTQMDKEMDKRVLPEKANINLIHYNGLFRSISNFQKRHSFFYMDMLEIARQYPEIINRYRTTIKKRRKQFSLMFSTLIEKKLIKPEPEIRYYEFLTHAIWVMSTYWLQQKKILGEAHPAINSNEAIDHIWKILLPHLTEKGIQEYKLIKNEKAKTKIGRDIHKK